MLVILGDIWLLGLKSLLYFLFLLLGLHFLLMFILFTAEKLDNFITSNFGDYCESAI